MTDYNYFIGIDISAATFDACIFQGQNTQKFHKAFNNDPSGFKQFSQWFKSFDALPENALICMENTGCYHQNLAYFLAEQKFNLVIEQPLKVKKAFPTACHKTDALDSQNIAEYAFRFSDRLQLWQPSEDSLVKIKQLLAARETLLKQKVALTNATTSYSYVPVQVNLIKKTYAKMIKTLEQEIKAIEDELQKIVDDDDNLKKKVQKLKSITGFGNLLSMHLIALIESHDFDNNYKKLSAFIGICPYKHESGTSVNKRARIRSFGSHKIKILLRLAAMSACRNDKKFKEYYLRKQNEGKAKSLVLNNIANKMLKISCALLRDEHQSFIKGHYSVNPVYAKA